MKKMVLFFLFLGVLGGVQSQNLTYNELKTLIDYKDYQIDTFLVKRQYKPTPKEQEGDTYYFRWNYTLDSSNVLEYNYVSVVDIYLKNSKNRLFRFGTLDPMVMVDIVEAMKEDGYVQKEKFDYGEQIHVYFVKGSEKIILKYITVKSKQKSKTVFEFELGS